MAPLDPKSLPPLTLLPQAVPGDSLLGAYLPLLQASFLALNASAPQLTDLCWLCLVASPPYLEAYAIEGNFSCSQEQGPPSCKWEEGPLNLALMLQAPNTTPKL